MANRVASLCLASLVVGLVGQDMNQSQSDRPSLRGKVIDEQRQPVAGAIVLLKSSGQRQARMTMTSGGGQYSFRDPSVGIDYELRTEHKGLSSTVTPLRLSDPRERVFIELQLEPQIQFDEISEQAGIDFTLRNAAEGQFHMPETMVSGVAAVDYDNDGCTDIYFVNGAAFPSLGKTGPEFHNRLFRNDCSMAFKDVTETAGVAGKGYSMAAATGDYDNDGQVDIFVAGVNHNTLYRNLGDGTFQDVTSVANVTGLDAKYGKMWAISAGWFDYDNDGWLDLFVANYVTWDPYAAPLCGKPDQRFYCHPKVYEGLPNQLYHNNGDGTFTDVSRPSGIAEHIGKGMGVAFGDVNQDGFTDVFVANDSVPSFLFRNNGDGTFEEIGLDAGVAFAFHGSAVAGMGADVRDYNNDGLDDIVLSAMYYDEFPLYRNLGPPRLFVDETVSSGMAVATRELTGWSLGMYDFDSDGHKDLFFATSHFPETDRYNPFLGTDASLPNHVFRNHGNGRFEDVSRTAGVDFQKKALHHGTAFADFDNDGRIDVVVSALNSTAKLFRNVSPGPAHWLALDLIGEQSNRDGIGAKVRLTSPAGGVQYNHATTSVGFASSSESVVRFGLGPYAAAKEIEIRWPSGRVQMLDEVRADQVLTVKER